MFFWALARGFRRACLWLTDDCHVLSIGEGPEAPGGVSSSTGPGAVHLPVPQEVQAVGTIDGWWYTGKHPCWRMCFHVGPAIGTRLALGDCFTRLVADGHLQRWWPGIYEPETAAFGGEVGVTAAHSLFVADS